MTGLISLKPNQRHSCDDAETEESLGRVGTSPEGGWVGYYRLYLLDGPGGRFVGFEEIEAADDAAALKAAEALPGTQHRELWCGKRKVKMLVPKGRAGEGT
jgi:hypothetical protein